MAKRSAKLAELESQLKRARKLNVALGVGCALLAVILIGQLAIGNDSPTKAEKTSERNAADGYDLRNRDDPMAIGDADAPIVMTWWTDMRCPFCGLFSRERLPKITEEYVDTGKLRIVVREAPLFGARSKRGAVAVRAAAEQGKFSAYLKAVYDGAPVKGKPKLSDAELVAFAKASGVSDLDKFRDELNDEQFAQSIDASLSSAQQIGVTSVPYFTIDDRSLAGAHPLSVFRQFIDGKSTGTNGPG